jgi:hypothetical protein
MARLTNKQRFERDNRQAKIDAYHAQEAKRATRIMADTGPVLWVLLILSAIALLTAFVFSYFALVEVAVWMRPPEPWLTFLVPGFIELMVVLSSVDYVVTRSRGGTGRMPLGAMIAASLIAVIGNAAHTVYEWLNDGDIPWEGYIGIGLAAIVPLVVVYISKRLTVTVFSEPLTLDN